MLSVQPLKLVSLRVGEVAPAFDLEAVEDAVAVRVLVVGVGAEEGLDAVGEAVVVTIVRRNAGTACSAGCWGWSRRGTRSRRRPYRRRVSISLGFVGPEPQPASSPGMPSVGFVPVFSM